MARPREFDRDSALQDAMRVFWAKGYAATSTDDLREAMSIGRQSLYNAFGDKRSLYLESFGAYLQVSLASQLRLLNAPDSPLAGIRDLLLGLHLDDLGPRDLGCMGVCSVGEFGTSDPEISALRERATRMMASRLIVRVTEGQDAGEIDPTLDPEEAVRFVQMTINGLQVAARAGADPKELASLAGFALDRLKAH